MTTACRREVDQNNVARVKIAAWCVVAVALVGGCADRTAPATTTSATESHCASATADALKSATQLNYGDAIVQPFTIDTIRCSSDWARARIPARSDYPQNSIVLFHYTGDGWSAVQFGSGFDCADEGVPASTAAELGC